MLAKRIIPCLDIKDGQTVKGINFKNLVNAGNPVALAKKYSDEGADELVFLDITATEDRRKTLANLVRDISETINIPFTVGGGISAIADVELLLKNGADKISINSAAVKDRALIAALSREFGSQCIVVAIDALETQSNWEVFIGGGKTATSLGLFDWAKEAEQSGAGEILFTSISHDGKKAGFANDALLRLSKTVNIPIIASGGAGSIADFTDVFQIGNADAALAASIFHFGEISITDLKKELAHNNIPIRL